MKIDILTVLIFLLLVFHSACSNDSVAEPKTENDDDDVEYSNAYIIQLSSKDAPAVAENYEELLKYHFYGICWQGEVEDNLKFSRQMGYKYVMYQPGMENSSLADNLFFYLESPEYAVYNELGVERYVDSEKQYTNQQISTYQDYFALKSLDSPFPENMATGWFSNRGFSVEPDWQQKKVIDFFTDEVIRLAKSIENSNTDFLFGGIAWDVPTFSGDFWGGGNQVTLAYWTGIDSGVHPEEITPEYSTYSKGRAVYLINLKNRVKTDFTGRNVNYIVEPYRPGEYIDSVNTFDSETRTKLLENIFISQEAGVSEYDSGTEFTEDNSLTESGALKKYQLGSSTPDNHLFETNQIIAAKAAVNGSWFNWYGRFSGTGDKIPITNIYEVPHWLQLIRVVPNWDNLSGVDLANRSWNGENYKSTNSEINEHIIYSRQPETQKLFAVFLDGEGEIELKEGETVVSVQRVDALFCETKEAADDLILENNIIKMAP